MSRGDGMRRHLRTGMFILVVVAAVAACGDDSSSTSTAGGSTEAEVFCRAWAAAISNGDDAAVRDALTKAPAALKGEARIVREADTGEDGSPEARAATSAILNWTELNCEQGKRVASTRRIAPALDAKFEGLTFCGTTAFPASTPSGDSGMVLYGEASAHDPYDGPMLGLLWNRADDGTHRGDGDAQPVTVRGQSGVAAPITVFQQTILPELGTVIAWTEGDRAFGLYGRRWSSNRVSELVEIANALDERSGHFSIASDALPDGYVQVFSGDPGVTSFVLPPSPTYSLRFQGQGGLLDVSGLQMTEGEFEAFRFFTIGVDQANVAGHGALMGNAWSADGPAVVTWREQDGLVVRIVGIGVPLATAEKVAERSRELSDDEWTALVEAADSCPGP